MTLGEVIAEYRRKNKITLGAFARKTGLSKSYLFALERNMNPGSGKAIKPTLETALVCCHAMEMDIVSFLKKVAPELADDLTPRIHVQTTISADKSSQTDSLPKPEAMFIPVDIPPHVPVNNKTVVEAFSERRILILRTGIPRKGDFVYAPIKEYMMVVSFTVLNAGGGLFLAHAEACGTCMFTIFDLGRSFFTKYGDARKIVAQWEWDAEQKNL